MTSHERALRRAADMFHEIVSAHSVKKILTRPVPEAMGEKLRGSLRSDDQICEIAADGFELCARALAELGAADVAIHECSALERHW
jgi:hypothetical protein